MQRAGAMNLLSFLMNDMTEYGKRIVACPTEDEAEEYIREQEE